LTRKEIHVNDRTDAQTGYTLLYIIGGLFSALLLMLGLVFAYAAS
jgi:hypothetical protein